MITETQKKELRDKIAQKLSDFVDETINTSDVLGFVPMNIETLMSEAAFNVLNATIETFHYLNENV